jgi:uncharacterized protein (TIGR03067 family)
MSKKDLERLQGSWRVAGLEMDGQAMPTDMLGEARVVVTATALYPPVNGRWLPR